MQLWVPAESNVAPAQDLPQCEPQVEQRRRARRRPRKLGLLTWMTLTVIWMARAQLSQKALLQRPRTYRVRCLALRSTGCPLAQAWLGPHSQFDWDPYVGTRVGEAAHPGPDANQQDSRLAAALLEVLQGFRNSDSPQAKADKVDAPHSGQQSTSLASRLFSVLQEALNQRWSDSKVADRVAQKIQAWQSQQPAAESPSGAPAGCPRQLPETARQVRLKPELKPPDQERVKAPRHSGGKPQSQPQFAVAVNPVEWDSEVKVTSLAAVRKALEDGEPLPGNLMLAQDPRVWYELRDLFAAHDVAEAFTFACPASADTLAPTLSVWWKSPKQAPRPQRQKLDVYSMTCSPGPDPRPPNQVVIRKSSGSEQCTLRLSAPEAYRCCFVGQGGKDSPSVIVAEWAKVLSVRTTPLTGGHWQTVHDTCGKVLVGYVRVPKSLAEKAVALSGKRALFASIVSNKTIGEKIRWMRRDRIVAHEDYFRYCARP